MRALASRLGWIAMVCATSAAAQSPPAPDAPRLSTVRTADGVDLLVAEAGDPAKPGILFIHGYAQSYLSFRRQFASRLARDHHLVAFDLRGHGGSSKPSDPSAYTDRARSGDDVAAVIATTHLVRPVIVGWSYGGVVVGDYLRGHGSGNVAGVVLAGTLGGFVKPTPAAPAAPPDALAVRIRAASGQSRALGLGDNISAAQTTGDAYVTPAMSAEDRRILFATELMLPAYVRRALTGRAYDNSDIVDRLARVPVLFVRGSGERGMPESDLAALRAVLPRSALSRYEGAGHLTFFEQPERFDDELARFAATAGARRGGDPAAAIPRPTLPMSRAAHRAFRDGEFAATDRNGDARIDTAELRVRAEAAGMAIASDTLARAMQINCGREMPACTRANFRAQGDREFARVDRDGDGVVTDVELKAAGGSMHAQKF